MVAQTVSCPIVPAHTQTVQVARLVDVEELVQSVFGVTVKVTHVHPQWSSGLSGGETVRLKQWTFGW